MEGFMGEVVASEVLLRGAQVTGDYIFAILPLPCRDRVHPAQQADTAAVGNGSDARNRVDGQTPRAGFEPATNRLTADRSTTELPRKTPGKPDLMTLPFGPADGQGGQGPAQAFAALPRADRSGFHAGGPVAALEFLKAVGDPQRGEG